MDAEPENRSFCIFEPKLKNRFGIVRYPSKTSAGYFFSVFSGIPAKRIPAFLGTPENLDGFVSLAIIKRYILCATDGVAWHEW